MLDLPAIFSFPITHLCDKFSEATDRQLRPVLWRSVQLAGGVSAGTMERGKWLW